MDTRFVRRQNPALLVVMALAALAMDRDVQAATYLVGGDGACDYNTIQAAINGAASSPGPDGIHIANNAAYSQQALIIGGQDLIIQGGYASCSSATPTVANTVIDGAGGAAAPVLRISGSGVRDLSNLTIRGGDSTGTNYGGGIQFGGSGDLILRGVSVSNNKSTYGGGIYFAGIGGPAVLTIETNTVILNNTAQNSGGGIYITGNARLFMLRDRTTVQGNTAVNGDGGGIEVQGPARADIASPGYINWGAIANNTAKRGGGIAVVSNSDGEANVRLFGVDATRPVRINGNSASDQGGAIWMKPYAFTVADVNKARACAFDILIDGNRAPEGAAFYGDIDSNVFGDVGSYFFINPNSTISTQCRIFFPETPESLGRVACTTGVNSCNFVANNIAANSAGAQTNGAIFYSNEGLIFMNNVVVLGNYGGNGIHGVGSNFVGLQSNLLIGNSLSGDVMRLEGDAFVDLIDNTIANNVNGGATHVLRFDSASTLTMRNNIIWQPGKLTLLYPGGLSTRDIQYNVVSDATTLPQGQPPTNLHSDPKFNDPSINDFGLRISSPALDFSPPVVGDDRGIDGRPRDQQVRPGGPRALVRDVGALERQRSDPYLINGTFDGSLRMWTNNFPDYTHWSTQDDGAGGGSGSTEMFIPGDQTGTPGGIQVASINGVTQCFSVPWVGTYKLRARGFTKANNLVTFPDTAAINWKLRFNSPNCTGPVNAEGDLFLPQNVGWNSEIAPFAIPIGQADWNHQTTLEINLVALQNLADPSTQNPIFVRLDNVVLEYQEDDRLFANGFE